MNESAEKDFKGIAKSFYLKGVYKDVWHAGITFGLWSVQ